MLIGYHRIVRVQSDIDQYIVERSGDGRTYSALGVVAATNGIGNHDYNYLDASPLTGVNFYRLRILETSGSVRYSTEVTMKASSDASQHVSVYPNPVKSNAILRGQLRYGHPFREKHPFLCS